MDANPNPDRPGRTWLVLGSLFAIVTLTFGTLQVVGLLAHEETDVLQVVDDPSVSEIDLHSDTGRIEIVGTDAGVITISGRISRGLRPTRFTHEVTGTRLRIRVDCPQIVGDTWCRSRLRIEVPRHLSIAAASGDGRVEVRGVSGEVHARSTNGAVEVSDLDGPVRASSRNGSVVGRDLRGDTVDARSQNGSVAISMEVAPRSVWATSRNGAVEVLVPDGDEAYAVDIRSRNGGTTNAVRSDPTSDRSVTLRSDNGSVTLRYRE